MAKNIIKINGTEIEEYKFHQYRSPILINNKDVNKIVVSNKFPFSKQDFKYSLLTKIIRKLDLYAYYFQK